MAKKQKAEPGRKTLEYFQALCYPYEVEGDEDGFVASHPDLLGCIAQGNSKDEAIAALDMARRVWLEVRFESGLHIPEAAANEDIADA